MKKVLTTNKGSLILMGEMKVINSNNQFQRAIDVKIPAIYSRRFKTGEEDPAHYYLGDIWKGFELGWGIDYVYQRFIVRPYRALSVYVYEVFDVQAIDGILVEGSARSVGTIARLKSQAQNGNVRTYAFVFLIGVVLVVGYMVFGA